MIALIVSAKWPEYYASSPFNNLLRSSHPRFKTFALLPGDLSSESVQHQINECEAIVVDDVLALKCGFYKNGPKFMVAGDGHAHTNDDAKLRDAQYQSVDYVLTSGYFAKKLPQYHWPLEQSRARRLFCPHTVPGHLPPPVTPFNLKVRRALLSGSISKEVYPFRKEVLASHARGVEVLTWGQTNHSAYFAKVSTYWFAITCPSVFECALAKYFEIPWCGTVLIAPSISQEEAELLGFKHEKNMVFVSSAADVSAIVSDLRKEEGLYERVTTEGQRLMTHSHTVEKRLEYIAALVDSVRAGTFRHYDCFDLFKKVSGL